MAEMAVRTTIERGTTSHHTSLPGGPRPFIAIGVGLAALVIIGTLNLMLGAVRLGPGEVWSGLTSDTNVFAHNVIWEIRFPRVVDGILVGASLAVAGTLLQGVTRNPLADPTILGITAAAGLASALVVVIDRQTPQWGIAMACAGGGLAGAGILFIIAWRGAISAVRLALAGVALSAFFGAAIVGLMASSRTFLQTSLGFLAGGMYGSGWSDFSAMWPYTAAGLAGALLLTSKLNVLALGEDIAAGLGVLTDRTRLTVLAVCGILTAAAVATAGLVSFVGLVCPHLAKFTVGSDHRLVVPVAALYGGVLVSAADLAARLVINPSEIPMGIITAAIGAPFLLFLVKARA